MQTFKTLDYLKTTCEKINDNEANFIIEPLAPGYGVTLGNSLRRVCLASLPGSAITTVKINNITHEFSFIEGIKEDTIEIILNLKTIRFKKFTDDPVTINLKVKGAKAATAKDFEKNPDIEILNPEQLIATVSKDAVLEITAIVESGTGYYALEKRIDENLPFGMIAIDANFTPIKKIFFEVGRTRIGQDTNFDKLVFSISTDGSITPEQSLESACEILNCHLSTIVDFISGKKVKTTNEEMINAQVDLSEKEDISEIEEIKEEVIEPKVTKKRASKKAKNENI
ncbi:MAG: DNA-directed RNA polymerase subunit alpha [Candidatus Berkelbacteria bacterium Licking1014_85]|uniref:DNA-directed RNA polymerase subunit alpha n=1 Tax=Candidatus Berkelbacteria bacterium Licking1014_85 TaxID=2017148 RepID=A0A554LMJ9_9BACT|nr:MAG: DNA-directed RNA polymerase subunit alpha [Candidatus Berkelbacteria bacterium Licking1014_85]